MSESTNDVESSNLSAVFTYLLILQVRAVLSLATSTASPSIRQSSSGITALRRLSRSDVNSKLIDNYFNLFVKLYHTLTVSLLETTSAVLLSYRFSDCPAFPEYSWQSAGIQRAQQLHRERPAFIRIPLLTLSQWYGCKKQTAAQ